MGIVQRSKIRDLSRVSILETEKVVSDVSGANLEPSGEKISLEIRSQIESLYKDLFKVASLWAIIRKLGKSLHTHRLLEVRDYFRVRLKMLWILNCLHIRAHRSVDFS